MTTFDKGNVLAQGNADLFMRTLSVVFLSVLCLIVIGCGGGGAVSTPTNPTPTLYISGYTLDSATSLTTATYWQNGVQQALPKSLQYSSASGVAVLNGSVHVVGVQYSGSSSQETAYDWVDGTPTALTNGNLQTDATAVYSDGNDVYVAGVGGEVTNNQATGGAMVWKDGAFWLETNCPSDDCVPLGIYVTGGHIYMSGFSANSNLEQPVVWTDENPAMLAFKGQSAYATGVVLEGTDVYVTGSDCNAGVCNSVYWKNGVESTLPGGDAANAITIANSNVYIAGTSSTGAVLWTNALARQLPGTQGYAASLAINSSDVYVVGSAGNDAGAGIWENGSYSALPVPNGSVSQATGITIVSGN